MELHNESLMELARLLDKLCEQPLEVEEQQRFNELLRLGPEQRAYYRRYLALHAAMSWDGSQAGRTGLVPAFETPAPLSTNRTSADPTEDATPRKAAPLPSGLRWPARALQFVTHPAGFSVLVALVTVVSLMLTAWQIPLQPNPPEPIAQPAPATSANITAQMLRLHEGHATVDGQPLLGDAQLEPGAQIELLKGELTLKFDGGAVVVLTSPARFTLNSRSAGRLERGRLTALVPTRARGFVVESPVTRIVDLGTEFFVDVAESGATEVQVLQGLVLLQGQNQTEERLKGGTARQVSVEGVVSSIRYRPEVAQRLRRPQPDADAAPRQLVLYYSFDDQQANDLSGNNQHGQLIGGPEFDADVPMLIARGRSLRLKNSTSPGPQRVETPHSPTLALESALSVSFWVKAKPAEQPLDFANLVSKLNQGVVNNRGWNIMQHAASAAIAVRIDTLADGGFNQVRTPQEAMLDGQWHHFALVVDASTATSYRDGRALTSAPYAGNGALDGGHDLVLGAQNRSGHRAFSGWLDELAIFNYPLMPREVAALAEGMSPLEIAAETAEPASY